MQRPRRGFTMLTVLWVLSVASVASLSFALAGRATVDGGRNRVNFQRARWTALGCARRMQAAIDSVLKASGSMPAAAAAWRTLPAHLGENRWMPRCRVELEAAGARLDVNTASEEMMQRLLETLGDDTADDHARAFIRWRTDSSIFVDVRQLSSPGGVDALAGLDSFATVEGGRIFLGGASPAVLMAVPGMTLETADSIAARAAAGNPIADLADILGVVSTASRDQLMSRYPDAMRVTTPDPDAWLLRASATHGATPVIAAMQWRLTRAGFQGRVVDVRNAP